jgi:hypothetical protein
MPPDPSDLTTASVAWYHPTLTTIDPLTRSLLEERGVPPADVLYHVQTIVRRFMPSHP